MPELHADALVLFGATGDLAHEQIFPALQALTCRSHLDVPVIGVAKPDWTVEALRAPAQQSLADHGGIDAEVFGRRAGRLSYVAGDYAAPETFGKLRQALGRAERPLFYLAIPPSLFGTVASGLARAGLAAQARVVVEKPFGRDLRSAKALNATIHESFAESAVYRIDHFSAKRRCRTSCTSGSRTRSWSRSGTRLTSRACRSRWRRPSASAAAAGSPKASALFGTSSRIICCRSSRCSRWNGRRQARPVRSAPPKVALLKAVRPLHATDVVRGQYRGYRTETRVAPSRANVMARRLIEAVFVGGSEHQSAILHGHALAKRLEEGPVLLVRWRDIEDHHVRIVLAQIGIEINGAFPEIRKSTIDQGMEAG